MKKYRDIYQDWQSNPYKFWLEQSENIDWFTKPTKAIDDSNKPFYKWFPDGVVNNCYNAVDRHVLSGRGDDIAIIYDSVMCDIKQKITFKELQDLIAKFAGCLKNMGINKGDRVIIYMPMIPEAIIAILGCARIGAIHSVVFGGFASRELAIRIDDCTPKVIISASCGLEPGKVVAYKPLLDKAIEMSQYKPDHCLIYQRLQEKADMITPRDIDWHEAMANATPQDCEALAANDILYILYTSGTTGQPKGVMRDNGGHAVAMHWTMKNIYNVNPGDVYWAASDVGWIVGHSYIVYAPLIYGATTLLYEGKPVGTPDAGVFWRIIDEYNVKILFTAPTALRAIKRVDSDGEFIKQYDISSLQALFLAGERADPETVKWSQQHLKCDVIDHWWQTETSWAIVSNPLGIEKLPLKLGSPAMPMPGYDVKILNDNGDVLPPNELGSVVVKLPLPPSTLVSLWNGDDRFQKSYLQRFQGYYDSGDAGYIDDDGYLYIMSRTDDVINIAGHRLSTGALEEVIVMHPHVAECAVIGVKDDLKGQVPLGLLCLNSNIKSDISHDDIINDVIQLVRDSIGPVAAFKHAVIVDRLPKTRSGKILRGTMLKIANAVSWDMPATIDDPEILNEITVALQSIGYGISTP